MSTMHNMSDRAKALYAFMRKEYLRVGYMYSGNITRPYACARLGLSSSDFSVALDDLVAAALAQRRACVAWCWELTPPVRYQLIYHHGLAERWQRDAPFFYPNAPHGEAERVTQHVADLCCALARQLLRLDALCPGGSAPQDARWAIVMPVGRGRQLHLAPLVMDEALAHHTLATLHVYAAAVLLATLQRVPVERFAQWAAAGLLGDPRLESPQPQATSFGRWVVPCLFPESGGGPPSPCLVSVSRVSSDPAGERARERLGSWREAVAAQIEGALRGGARPEEEYGQVVCS